MATDDGIPFVDPPANWLDSGAMARVPGTRWWVEDGPRKNFKHWVKEVHEAHPGNLIPLQWVPEFVGVTRAAVRRRAKAGGLTVFSFLLEQRQTLLGRVSQRETRSRYEYAVISECKAWRALLYERADKTGKDLDEVTDEEFREP